MAEIAMLVVALGGLYVISNHDNEPRELAGFENMGEAPNALPSINPPQPPINYPIDNKRVSDTNPNKYYHPNQTTDKFFTPSAVYKEIERNNPKESVGGSTKTNYSLTGEPLNKDNFKHNNMVPFFGSRIKGSSVSADIAQSQLDNMQGSGSQHKHKTEQAPLFKPQTNMSWANGMPSTTEFMLSREVPSNRINNVKPWDEVKVAPGLGHGYTSTNSGSGYNTAVEDRSSWLPKTVDALRATNNPKVSFDLSGHQGPASASNQNIQNSNTMGRVEKNRPDTTQVLGPNRWFTTTGVEKGSTVRSSQMLQHTNRPDYSETNYYGAGTQEGKSTYIHSHSNETHRQQLAGPAITAPLGPAAASTNDYGNGSYEPLCNNRSTTRQGNDLGAVGGILKALTSPILDILKPTRKENVIGNIRSTGNVQLTHGGTQPICNPGDRPKTTIKEQTEIGKLHLNLEGNLQGAYNVSTQQPVPQERDTTTSSYIGNVMGTNQSMSQTSAYNQRNNPNKTFSNHPNQGGMSLLNADTNFTSVRNDQNQTRIPTGTSTMSAIPSKTSYGRTQMPPTTIQPNYDRMNPDLLNAFKSNPYTHSLTSWA